MDFNLAAMTIRAGVRRRGVIVFPKIQTTTALAADLAAIYMQVVKAWQTAATEQIAPAYAAALPKVRDHGRNMVMVADDLSDVSGTVNSAAEQVNRLVLSLTPSLRQWALRLEKWHRSKWIRTVISPTSVDLSTLIGAADVQETIEAILARNMALIRSVAEETRARISDIVFRGFQARTETTTIGRQLRDATGMSRRRALGIASDQTVKLSSALDTERMRQAGIDEWKWRHSGKVHFRPEHKARDGKLYTFENAPSDMPGDLPWCGCHKQAVLNLDVLRLAA